MARILSGNNRFASNETTGVVQAGAVFADHDHGAWAGCVCRFQSIDDGRAVKALPTGLSKLRRRSLLAGEFECA
jgi:hypothetical protein